jgi:hypothetical protein
MLKKGNYFAVDDDDDDAVRTSVSQNRVTATMWTEEFFLKTQYYIVLPSYKPGKSVGGRNGWSTRHLETCQLGSQLPANPLCDKTGFTYNVQELHTMIL